MQRSSDLDVQPSGRMSTILRSNGPIQVVISSRHDVYALQAALRLIHAMNVYHKLDAVVVDASEMSSSIHRGASGLSNIVVLGGGNNNFLKALLASGDTPFTINEEGLLLNDRQLSHDSTALFLHPHPVSSTAAVMVMYAGSEAAMERALRLFPIRTGIAVPDWIVVDERVDKLGAGGVQAAGSVPPITIHCSRLTSGYRVWGDRWSWNGGMSSF